MYCRPVVLQQSLQLPKDGCGLLQVAPLRGPVLQVARPSEFGSSLLKRVNSEARSPGGAPQAGGHLLNGVAPLPGLGLRRGDHRHDLLAQLPEAPFRHKDVELRSDAYELPAGLVPRLCRSLQVGPRLLELKVQVHAPPLLGLTHRRRLRQLSPQRPLELPEGAADGLRRGAAGRRRGGDSRACSQLQRCHRGLDVPEALLMELCPLQRGAGLLLRLGLLGRKRLIPCHHVGLQLLRLLEDGRALR
mmetsp:Transcript_29821/g.84040  ORF Transcript_29821/g.84040 Transcript_29821/m.84040 type:complete len:246 (-) Transcript_29821:437-1174(-)